MTRLFAIVFAALGLSASQAAVPDQPVAAATEAIAAPDPVRAGYDLSEALCSGCHAIAAGRISPNPQSPTFEMIANTQGLTDATLRDWLRDSHNFPETMNFEVVEEDVDVLAAYIITLRREDYKPPIQ